jgi:hypothetical protein
MLFRLFVVAALAGVTSAAECEWHSAPPPPTPCTSGDNSCYVHNHDGYCDDGGPGSQFNACSLGTDCSDCGGSRRSLEEYQPSAEALEKFKILLTTGVKMNGAHPSEVPANKMRRRLDYYGCDLENTRSVDCGGFMKNSDCQETYSFLGYDFNHCCAESDGDCCEVNVGAVVGVSVGAAVGLALIIFAIIACCCMSCCKCCPCNKYNKKNVSPS